MASKKTARIEKFVYVLEHASSWVSAAKIANMLETGERTVRNYVAEINRGGAMRIESSGEGYRLAAAPSKKDAAQGGQIAEAPSLRRERQNVAVARRNYVLSRLINAHEEISVFDLADELCISESTLSSSVMPQARKLVEEFGLAIVTHDFQMSLEGSEQSKRKLLGHMAANGADGYFSSTEMLAELFPSYDVQGILTKLVEICQRSELLVNDYALNNLLMHILVIVIRLTSENGLAEHEDVPAAKEAAERLGQRSAVNDCARRIARYLEEEFGCSIPAADYQQLVLLIALSAEHFDYSALSLESLEELVGQEFLNTVRNISGETADRYGIPRFDDTILLQLTLHMFNAYQRSTYHVSYPNPLASQIKSDYAPVYDMAVHFAHRFSKAFGCTVDENEIAFVAFHIGAHLERCANVEQKASCVIVVSQYHDFGRQLVDDIAGVLGDEANVVAVMNRDEYLRRMPPCDLVVSTADVPVGTAELVVIGPILNKRCIQRIHEALSQVVLGRLRGQARKLLRGMLCPELYFRNVNLGDSTNAYIDFLGNKCQELGFVGPEYVNDARLREQISSTAFTDTLAVPHSISCYAERSFICVLHNDASIPWGRHNVRFVLLIGIAEEDMRHFRIAFDIIVETFSSVDKTMGLLQTRTFDEFARAFCQEMA